MKRLKELKILINPMVDDLIQTFMKKCKKSDQKINLIAFLLQNNTIFNYFKLANILKAVSVS